MFVRDVVPGATIVGFIPGGGFRGRGVVFVQKKYTIPAITATTINTANQVGISLPLIVSHLIPLISGAPDIAPKLWLKPKVSFLGHLVFLDML
ncbi:MAG: hypothetical protein SLRJCFUN_000071 [Candidatus Fervidibacter sp.]